MIWDSFVTARPAAITRIRRLKFSNEEDAVREISRGVGDVRSGLYRCCDFRGSRRDRLFSAFATVVSLRHRERSRSSVVRRGAFNAFAGRGEGRGTPLIDRLRGVPLSSRGAVPTRRATGWLLNGVSWAGQAVTSNRHAKPGKLTQRGRPDPCVFLTEGRRRRASRRSEGSQIGRFGYADERPAGRLHNESREVFKRA